MQLGSDPTAIGQQLFSSSASPVHKLGDKAVINGRVFRYAKAGTVALVAGNCIQQAAPTALHLGIAPAAAAVGAKQVTVTLGATLATENQYAGGYLVVRSTPGEGYMYQIDSHPAAALSASLVVNLQDEIQVALTTGSRVDLVPAEYNSVIQTPITTLTGVVAGVAIYPIAISQYGWLQTRGPAPVLIDGTPGVGFAVGCPAAVAGAAAIFSSTLGHIGWMMALGVTAKIMAVDLRID